MIEINVNMHGKNYLGTVASIVYEGEKETGLMFGSQECFDVNEFYQWFTIEDKIYRLFYEIKDGQELDEIDYTKPYRKEEVPWSEVFGL